MTGYPIYFNSVRTLYSTPLTEAGELKENALQNKGNDTAIAFAAAEGNRGLGTCCSLEGRSLFEIDFDYFRRGCRAKITRMLSE